MAGPAACFLQSRRAGWKVVSGRRVAEATSPPTLSRKFYSVPLTPHTLDLGSQPTLTRPPQTQASARQSPRFSSGPKRAPGTRCRRSGFFVFGGLRLRRARCSCPLSSVTCPAADFGRPMERTLPVFGAMAVAWVQHHVGSVCVGFASEACEPRASHQVPEICGGLVESCSPSSQTQSCLSLLPSNCLPSLKLRRVIFVPLSPRRISWEPLAKELRKCCLIPRVNDTSHDVPRSLLSS